MLGNALLPTGAAVLWIAHNILEYQPMSLTIMPQSTDKYYLLVFAIATYATSFTLGILNTVPQLLGTEDIDYFTSPHIVKSLIPIWLNRSTLGRSILQHAYVLLHFANTMRLPVYHGQRGNTRYSRNNNWFGYLLYHFKLSFDCLYNIYCGKNFNIDYWLLNFALDVFFKFDHFNNHSC